MREIYKNPMLYYLIAPLLAALWPSVVMVKYLPEARRQTNADRVLYEKGKACIADILKYDPQRLVISTATKGESGEFSFAKAIDQVANTCRIPSTGCDYTAGSADKKTQNAKVTLKSVSIVQAASFLSRIQSSWVGLKCEQIKLTQKEGVADQWDVEMKFWYAS